MKRIAAIILSLAMLLAMTACGAGTEAAQGAENTAATEESAAAGSKDLVVGTGPMDTLDSRNSVSADSYTIISLCGEGLFRNVNGDAVPALCESYEVNGTNTEYTFHLRESVWADGTPVTANDFVYAVLSLLNPENACAASTVSPAYNLVGADAYLFGEGTADDVAIKATDDYTLTMSFAASVYPIQLCDRTMLPIQQAKLEAAGSSYGTNAESMMSNGPFMVDSWGEDKLVIVRNEKYWDAESIHLDSITYIFGADNETGLDMLLSGEIQMSYLGNANQINTAKDAGMNLYECSGGYEYFYINHSGRNAETAEFIQNQNFRLALSAALDRQALVNTVFTSYQVTDRLIDSNEKGVNGKFVDEYPYSGWSVTADLEAAQKYLDAALEELGKTVDEIPTFTLLCVSGTDTANIASAVADMWGKIGVKLEYDGQDFMGYVNKGYSGDFDFMELGAERSPVDWFEGQGKYFVSPASALVYYESEEFDALADAVRTAPDWASRKDAMFEMEKFATEQCLVLDIANVDQVYAAAANVTGIYASYIIDLTYADLQ